MTKHDLRRALLAQRQAIHADTRTQADAALGEHVRAWWKSHPVRALGIYWPIRGEPDLRPAYVELAMLGVQLGLPVIAEASAPLQFMRWSPGEDVAPGKMQVPVPAQAQISMQPEALLIPCVGFNRQRVRLGYGGGLYDRTLALAEPPMAVGIAYANALVDFAAAPHDIEMDAIITENGRFIGDRG